MHALSEKICGLSHPVSVQRCVGRSHHTPQRTNRSKNFINLVSASSLSGENPIFKTSAASNTDTLCKIEVINPSTMWVVGRLCKFSYIL